MVLGQTQSSEPGRHSSCPRLDSGHEQGMSDSLRPYHFCFLDSRALHSGGGEGESDLERFSH